MRWVAEKANYVRRLLLVRVIFVIAVMCRFLVMGVIVLLVFVSVRNGVCYVVFVRFVRLFLILIVRIRLLVAVIWLFIVIRIGLVI